MVLSIFSLILVSTPLRIVLNASSSLSMFLFLVCVTNVIMFQSFKPSKIFQFKHSLLIPYLLWFVSSLFLSHGEFSCSIQNNYAHGILRTEILALKNGLSSVIKNRRISKHALDNTRWRLVEFGSNSYPKLRLGSE